MEQIEFQNYKTLNVKNLTNNESIELHLNLEKTINLKEVRSILEEKLKNKKFSFYNSENSIIEDEEEYIISTLKENIFIKEFITTTFNNEKKFRHQINLSLDPKVENSKQDKNIDQKYDYFDHITKTEFQNLLDKFKYLQGYKFINGTLSPCESLPYKKKEIGINYADNLTQVKSNKYEVVPFASLKKCGLLKQGIFNSDLDKLKSPFPKLKGFIDSTENSCEETYKQKFSFYHVDKLKIDLSNFRELTEEFKYFFADKLKKLETLQEFIDKYGSYVVSEIIVGGLIYYTEIVQSKPKTNLDEDEKKTNKQKYTGYFTNKTIYSKDEILRFFQNETSSFNDIQSAIKDEEQFKSFLNNHLNWSVINLTLTRTVDLFGTKFIEDFYPRNLIAASQQEIFIYDSLNFKCIKSFKAHEDHINCILFLSNGHVATASGDRTIKIWDMKTYHCEYILQGHIGGVLSLIQLRNGLLASSSFDKSIKLWNPNKKYQCIHTLIEHTFDVRCLLQLNNDVIASGSLDKTIKLWDPKLNYSCYQTLLGHNCVVTCLVQLPNDMLCSGSVDSTIKVWNSNSNFNCIKTLIGHSQMINNLVYLENGYLLSCSNDNSVVIWDSLNKLEFVTCIGEDEFNFKYISKLRDGSLASFGYDNHINIMNPYKKFLVLNKIKNKKPYICVV